MSSVFQTIDPPPPLRPASVPPPRLCCGGRTHLPGGEGGGGSIFWKTQGPALYSPYIKSSLLSRINQPQSGKMFSPLIIVFFYLQKEKNWCY
jgi:hypothetical protein